MAKKLQDVNLNLTPAPTDTILVKYSELVGAFVEWERGVREGETLSDDEVDAKPVEEVSSERANSQWQLLGGQVCHG